MAHRYIEDSALRRALRQAMPSGTARDLVWQAIERFLHRQPRAPRLVGTTAAAEILGIQPPHVTRLKDQGRMPEPIRVEGSVEVYLRDEVEALGRQLYAEREQRAAKRAKREAT